MRATATAMASTVASTAAAPATAATATSAAAIASAASATVAAVSAIPAAAAAVATVASSTTAAAVPAVASSTTTAATVAAVPTIPAPAAATITRHHDVLVQIQLGPGTTTHAGGRTIRAVLRKTRLPAATVLKSSALRFAWAGAEGVESIPASAWIRVLRLSTKRM